MDTIPKLMMNANAKVTAQQQQPRQDTCIISFPPSGIVGKEPISSPPSCL